MKQAVIGGGIILVVLGLVFFLLQNEGGVSKEEKYDDIHEHMTDEEHAHMDDASETMAGLDIDAGVELSGAVKEFTIDSFNFGYSEDVIEVWEGDTVRITLTNSEGMHDWVVDEFGVATEVITAGETSTVEFVATEAGEYEFYCSVGSHRAQGMVGLLQVKPR